MPEFDAVVIVSFGGPEGHADVVPFLENVTRGRGVPRDRLAEVRSRYDRLGGVSPINDQCRRLRASLIEELHTHGLDMGVYWGNRNWHPYLAETLGQMTADGVRRGLALVTSAYSSYSGCRQYLEDIERARAEVGDNAPEIEKIRPYFDHPGFIEPFIEATADALGRLGAATPPPLVFTAHSLPEALAAGCDYESQLRVVAAMVAAATSPASPWALVWQSRSGPPSVPWLVPDVDDHLRSLAAGGNDAAVIVPIGFVSDHMEIVWDLDHGAQATASELGMRLERVTTPATEPDPRFVTMCRQLIEERTIGGRRLALSEFEARPDLCAPTCCPGPRRPSSAA